MLWRLLHHLFKWQRPCFNVWPGGVREPRTRWLELNDTAQISWRLADTGYLVSGDWVPPHCHNNSRRRSIYLGTWWWWKIGTCQWLPLVCKIFYFLWKSWNSLLIFVLGNRFGKFGNLKFCLNFFFCFYTLHLAYNAFEQHLLKVICFSAL